MATSTRTTSTKKDSDAEEALLEAQGDATLTVDNPTVPTGELIWVRHPNGLAHNVAFGSEAHKRLIEVGATPIDGPSDEDTEVDDFAMLEKAKADSARR